MLPPSPAAPRPASRPGAPRPTPRPVRAVTPRLGAMLLLWAAAALLGLLLPSLPALEAWDRAGVTAVSAATGPAAASLAAAIDLLLGRAVAPVVALVVLALLVARVPRLRRWWEVLRTALLILVPWAAAAVLKLVVQRPRPAADLSALDTIPTPVSFSYPSGHTAIAGALCCAVLLARRPRRGRWVLVTLAMLVVALTGWSRVALGVHHPGDVLVSALLVPALAVLLAGALDAVGPTDPAAVGPTGPAAPPTVPPSAPQPGAAPGPRPRRHPR